MNDKNQTVTIKKYANRRLYNTATSTYVTLEDLSAMVKEGTKFNVYDAKSSEDITRSVLTQIIVEEENKTGQQNLLPINFLRQLIGFYGDSLQWMVPKYLEHSMEALTGNQDQIRDYYKNTLGSMFPFGSTLEEMSKQNMSMFENTLRMFTPLTNLNFGLGSLDNNNSTTSDKSSCCSTTAATSCCATTKPAAAAAATTKVAVDVAPVVTTKSCSLASTSDTKASNADNKATTATTATPNNTNNNSNNNGNKTETQTASVTNLKPRNDTNKNSSVTTTPMPNVQTVTTSNTGADDMQQKIANLQRQLADLAKSRA